MSNLRVLAPNAISEGVRGAGGLPLGPPGGGRPPTSPGEHHAIPGWLSCDALRWGASGLAAHPHGLGQRPRHRQQVSMATAAREQHKVRGRHLGCTTLTRTADASPLLRIAAQREVHARATRKLPLTAYRGEAQRTHRRLLVPGRSAAPSESRWRPGAALFLPYLTPTI